MWSSSSHSRLLTVKVFFPPTLLFHLEKQVSARALCPWSGALQAEVQTAHAPLRIPSEGQEPAPGVQLWRIPRSPSWLWDPFHHRSRAWGHLRVHAYHEQRRHGARRCTAWLAQEGWVIGEPYTNARGGWGILSCAPVFLPLTWLCLHRGLGRIIILLLVRLCQSSQPSSLFGWSSSPWLTVANQIQAQALSHTLASWITGSPCLVSSRVFTSQKWFHHPARDTSQKLRHQPRLFFFLFYSPSFFRYTSILYCFFFFFVYLWMCGCVFWLVLFFIFSHV